MKSPRRCSMNHRISMSRPATSDGMPGFDAHSRHNGPAKAPGVVKARNAPVAAEALRTRAYEIYLERCEKGAPGDELSDWAQAERELSSR